MPTRREPSAPANVHLVSDLGKWRDTARQERPVSLSVKLRYSAVLEPTTLVSSAPPIGALFALRQAPPAS